MELKCFNRILIFRGDNIRTMAKFAAAMMRALADLKAKSDSKMPDVQLRIGEALLDLSSIALELNDIIMEERS